MKLSLIPHVDGQKAKDVLVIFSSQKSSKTEDKKKQVQIHDADLQIELAGLIQDESLTGKAQEALVLREKQWKGFRHLLVVGLGSDWQNEGLRQAGAVILNSLNALKATSAVVEAESALSVQASSMSANLQALVEGMGLASYDFNELKSTSKKEKKKNLEISIACKEASKASSREALEKAQILTECVNFSRRLGDMPGNLMTPTILAQEVVRAARGTKAKCSIWDKARIKKEKMGGLLGVAQGSDEDPRFIIVEYRGAGLKEKPVVFVGKGLTFDTGGISIKPSAAMEEMKYDMCGGANVLGAVLALAKIKAKVNVIGLVPATENMPGGRATKPGDVHVARNGKSFEVNNTDAEGRLILSDALCYGSELKPKAMIDAATLTGAMVVALGNTHTGYFTRHQELSSRIEAAAKTSGEWVWRMPLVDHHVSDMKGTFADLSNISSSKGAGSATAAAFLEQFVDKSIPWAHFDIAGTAWAVGNRLPYCSKKGASGCMIRTFVALAINLAEEDLSSSTTTAL